MYAVKSESGTCQSMCQEGLEICPSTEVILIVVLYIYMYPTLLAGRPSVYPLGAHL